MKITLISLDNWGFNKHIAIALEKKGHVVRHIDFNTFKYKYPHFLYKIYNFLLKSFLNKNLKSIFYGEKIIQILEEHNEIQDLILTIRADFIDPNCLLAFKKYTKKSIAFFNDSIAHYPQIASVLKCFDEVYSFEKEDCRKYRLKFKTNFIYNYAGHTVDKSDCKYQLFNISSRNKRTGSILKIAQALKNENINYKIIVLDKKNRIQENELITVIRQPLCLDQVNEYIYSSQIALEIQREDQAGLTFRVFESLGLEKKLITTNADVKNYDFFNPNNVLVIDINNPVFPKSFFETPYQRIPEETLQQYLVENWIDSFVDQ
jgi:hypothetical protein